MDFYSDLAQMYLEQFLVSLGMIFIGGSIVLFVIDCIKAKKENRKVKLWVKVLFIISLSLIALLIIGMILIVLAMCGYIFGWLI